MQARSTDTEDKFSQHLKTPQPHSAISPCHRHTQHFETISTLHVDVLLSVLHARRVCFAGAPVLCAYFTGVLPFVRPHTR